jgi:hypothetical protein
VAEQALDIVGGGKYAVDPSNRVNFTCNKTGTPDKIGTPMSDRIVMRRGVSLVAG